MPKVNPDILVWAREIAALSLEEAAKKIGRTCKLLSALERGEKDPSLSMLLTMAKKYRCPLVTFYLDQPPRKGDYGVDYRTLPKEGFDPKEQALVDALISNVVASQQMIRATLEAEDEAEKVAFIGSLHAGSSIQNTVKKISKVLELDVEGYRREKTKEKAFSLLRLRLEEAGTFVLLKKNLGSFHTNISVEAFRGFAIADPISPYIVINHNDSVAARTFTLLHELTHLLLGETGISGSAVSTQQEQTEKFCNAVASEWLLPAKDLDTLVIDDNLKESISRFALKHHLSKSMVAYRLLLIKKIDEQFFNHLKNDFIGDWKQLFEAKKTSKSCGGPNYYAMQKFLCGPALCNLVKRMMYADALSVTKAARILGVHATQVYKMLGDAQ